METPLRIYTSRYQNIAEAARLGLKPIGITAGRPRFKLAAPLAGTLAMLAPDRAVFNKPDWADHYRAKLDQLDVARVRVALLELGQGQDVCLLCYECIHGGREHCHRWIFADWWTANTGEHVIEIDDRAKWNPPKPSGGQQLTFDRGAAESRARAAKVAKLVPVVRGRLSGTARNLWPLRVKVFSSGDWKEMAAEAGCNPPGSAASIDLIAAAVVA